jgi:thiol-disulfide isomerase/thioredoxin
LVRGEGGIPESITQLAQGALTTTLLPACQLSAIAMLLLAGVVGTVFSAQQATVQSSRRGSATPGAGRDQPTPAARSNGRAATTPRQQYEALIAEYARIQDEVAKLTDAQQIKASFPVERKVVGRFLDLARKHPQDAVAFDALAWVTIWGFTTAESETAAELLAQNHAQDRRLWLICQDIRRGPISLPRATLLRAVLAHNPDRSTRGRACFDLAQLLIEQSEFVRLLKTPGLKPYHANFYPAERLARFGALDADALTQEAEKLLVRVLDEFADVVPVKWSTEIPRMENWDPATLYRNPPQAEREPGTLADRARPALAELRGLSVGKVAPEIEGVDVGGRPFKLSDYRGKVVVLDFSGTWCGYCKQMYPHFREIVERFKDRPFVLLGVMADENREALEKEIASGEITWRCWWEKGGTEGPIPHAWNVRGYPTVYVLDTKGVIRLKFTGVVGSTKDTNQPAVDQFLERLLDEAKPDRRP